MIRCATCNNELGEVTRSPNEAATTTIKLSKYLARPIYATPPSSASDDSESIWVGTLLATLQYAAASHGSRRFLLPSPDSPGVEAWLFSRARFTTTLSRHWPTLNPASPSSCKDVWRGYRVFYRPPSPPHSSTSAESVETVELPHPIYNWTTLAMSECNTSLPKELREVLPGWSGAYLARKMVG